MTGGEIIGAVSLAADALTVLGFVVAFRNHVRKLGVKDGEHMEIHRQLRTDIEDAKKRVEKIDSDQTDMKVAFGKLDTKLDGITGWLTRIAAKMGVA